MAEEKKPAAAAPAVKKPAGDAAKKFPRKPRNYDLGNGIYRFSRCKMYHKKALWLFMGKKTPKVEKPKKKTIVVKPIGGEKNGSTRVVSLIKKKKSYPTCDRTYKHPAKKCFKDHKHKFRASLTQGKVVILLAGVHKGKRAILLKTLKSGLLIVTGPFTLNGVPMRLVHPSLVIATSTTVDISKVEIPSHIDDKYFKKPKVKRTKKQDGDLFVVKKKSYKASDQRKADQKIVDKQIIKAIKAEKDSLLLRKYLCTMFGLQSKQYPHRMKF